MDWRWGWGVQTAMTDISMESALRQKPELYENGRRLPQKMAPNRNCSLSAALLPNIYPNTRLPLCSHGSHGRISMLNMPSKRSPGERGVLDGATAVRVRMRDSRECYNITFLDDVNSECHSTNFPHSGPLLKRAFEWIW